MNQIKIAIIDTGLNENIYHYKNIIGKRHFYIKNSCIYMNDDVFDYNGHGTSCAEIISRHCQSCMLYIIKITQGNMRTTYSCLLIEALNYLLNVDVDIINISMSLRCEENREEMEVLLQQLRDQNKIIVVSVVNGEKQSYPANSEYCIGVRAEFEYDYNYSYSNYNKVQIVCNMFPELVLNSNYKYYWFSGNSKETAFVSALIGNIIHDNDKKDLDSLLTLGKVKINNAKKPKWNEKDYFVFEKMEFLFFEYIEGYDGDENYVVLSSDSMKLVEIDEFLGEIENLFEIRIDRDKILFEDFYSVTCIVKMVTGSLRSNSNHVQ